MRVLAVGLATFDQMTGGSARYLSGMIAALEARGHQVDVVTAGQAVPTRGFIPVGIGGQVVRLARRLWLVHARAAATVIRDRPDVVNVHFAYDGVGAVMAARLIRTPIVVMFQGPWAREAAATGLRGRWPLSTKARRFIERRVYRSAARCIVLSGAFRDLLAADYGVEMARIVVIPPGIDLADYAAEIDRTVARRKLDLPERPTIVTVRRLVHRMGIDMLIEALSRVPAGDRPHLAIAGIGPDREALAARASELGLEQDVSFLGRVPDDDLPVLYAAADLSVVPSRALEGFGYVVLESYAAGTPVLATRVGGLVDVVGAFDPDRLVEPDPASLAAALRSALQAPAPVPAREACRAYAGTFAWDRIAPRVEQAFLEARGVR
jgi:glycosyltransferase involved in cell wall biosynthesis